MYIEVLLGKFENVNVFYWFYDQILISIPNSNDFINVYGTCI